MIADYRSHCFLVLWVAPICVCSSSVCVCARLGGSDGGAPAEAQQDLLTVLQGPTVSHTLQGALGLSQQAGAVPGRG